MGCEDWEQAGGKDGGYTGMIFMKMRSILEEIAKKERNPQRAGADLRSQ